MSRARLERLARRALMPLALAYVAAIALHGVDHGRRDALPLEIVLGGTASTLAGVLVIALARRRPRAAAAVAAGVAGPFGLALLTVHVGPRFNPISDPYEEAAVGAVSWTTMGLAVGFALALGAAGALLAARARGRPLPGSGAAAGPSGARGRQ